MTDLGTLLAEVEGFDWDAGNAAKNVLGHGVSQAKAEMVFFIAPIVLLEDQKHSAVERRYQILGPTAGGRFLTAAFTLRQHRIRIVSIRDMSRPERRRYVQAR